MFDSNLRVSRNSSHRNNLMKETTMSKKTVNLTESQTKVLNVLYKLQRNLRRAPTQVRIAEEMGLARTTVNEHLCNMHAKGALQFYGEKNRVMYYKINRTK